MAKSATVRARVDPALKLKAERVLERLGLNSTVAITLYYQQIVRRRGIPFEVTLPNAATRRAMRDAESGQGITRARSARELLARLHAEG